jgi:hypothetical protein
MVSILISVFYPHIPGIRADFFSSADNFAWSSAGFSL